MNLTTFSFSSKGKDQLQIVANRWKPDIPARAVVQIVHGMAEHINRYDAFASFLIQRGLVVYGNDHRGHGRTAGKENRGWFAEDQGFEQVVQDLYRLTQIIRREQPGLPLFLFGHSMGSFLARRIIQLHGDEYQGVILCGTGGDPGWLGRLGLRIARREVKKKGSQTPSPMMAKLITGGFNRRFRPRRTEVDWLSRDEREVDKYLEDSFCGGVLTAGFYRDLLEGLIMIHREENIQLTPKNLPILLISGEDDPVGDFGKGVRRVVQRYRRAGIKDLRCKLYTGARHELLNELNREEVVQDVINWLEKHIN
ncbi:alpha/beta hydrolase [Kroppenstedtia guangzhouensis]|uniref:Alpha/beta hydrolase n=1 Tax=Kroppenstedtia guangzhouensis TaxID=1274356 RepID=A0ABQ1G8V1_9BACL|nr:alpha/beta hydrolase [Kroppenstedtia guangzhouensis]GGA39042.1 alpha/beta hydrolase [Kroppenstedtia guangzhouensis]